MVVVATIVDKFAQISAASGDKPQWMRPVIDLRPILRRGGENFRNWLLLSALRCILLTNNCGQSFSHPHNQDLKSAIKPKRAAFCTGTHFRKSCSRIKKCSLFVLFSQKWQRWDWFGFPSRVAPADDSINLCSALGPGGNQPTTHQLEAATRERLSKAWTSNVPTTGQHHHHQQRKSNNVKINTGRPSGNDVNKGYDEGWLAMLTRKKSNVGSHQTLDAACFQKKASAYTKIQRSRAARSN